MGEESSYTFHYLPRTFIISLALKLTEQLWATSIQTHARADILCLQNHSRGQLSPQRGGFRANCWKITI